MKTIPNYSHVILYKNEISMLEFYKNMKIKGLQEESYNFSNSFSSFLNCMFVDFTFSKTSVGIECYDKKIKTAQEKIKGLEEIYDFSTFNLEQSKNSIEIVVITHLMIFVMQLVLYLLSVVDSVNSNKL